MTTPARRATGEVLLQRGDARHLPPVPRRLRGVVDLVVTTPGRRLHPPGRPARRWSNAGMVRHLETDLKLCLASWIPLLHPGTVLVLTTRLLPRDHQLLDLTVPIAYAAGWAGLELIDRVAALRVPVQDSHRAAPRRRGAARPRVLHDDGQATAVVLDAKSPTCRVRKALRGFPHDRR